jgi:hypothetical protein
MTNMHITTKNGERREIEWKELNQLRKDILWLYDQNVGDIHHPFIPDDSFLSKYWEYLKLDGDKFFLDEERKFYKEGVLIITLYMTLEYIDTIGGNQHVFGKTKIDEVIHAVDNFEPTGPEDRKLRDIVKFGLIIANSMTYSDLRNTDGFEHKDLDNFHEQLDWVDSTFVKAYFKERVK